MEGGADGVNPNRAYNPDYPDFSSQEGASHVILRLNTEIVNPHIDSADPVNNHDAAGDVYVVFDSTQIKHAFLNNNEFDYGDPDILRQEDTRLAPNGKPSKLNAVQYTQVRTPEFKKFFGDWEALAKATPERTARSFTEAVKKS